ncbi:hypothetical protein AGMMS49944_04370 [Spirochaetia bacterium]|nr:hypothetical protein AGMMS49944_04370 [Spirochaetia bacterium]
MGVLLRVGIFLVLALPVWGHGKQDSKNGNWEPVDGRELWQKEYDISGLKKGKYNFTVRARDAAGNETLEGPYTFTVDPQAGAPVIQPVFPGVHAVIYQDIDFLGTAGGYFEVDLVTVRLDELPPVPADGAGYWKYRVNTSAGPDSISEGRHTLYVKARDIKGLEGPELEIPFIFDKTPPEVEFLAMEAGQIISGNQTLRGFASDLNGIARAEFSSDGGLTFSDIKFIKNKRDPKNVTFSVPFNTAKMRDGEVFCQLRATDSSGLVTTRPYLFNVDNEKPIIRILSPAEGENCLGTTRVTGMVYDVVGLSQFYYEWEEKTDNKWEKKTHDIPIRPGDPYWAIDLFISYQRPKPTLRIIAVDKNNHTTVVTRLFTDSRKGAERTPAVQIDYPARTDSLGPDQSIFGQIAPGFTPASIIMEERIEELPAQPGFRISPDMIPPGRSAIRLWAKAEDGTVGAPYTLQVNKNNRQEVSTIYSRPSPLVITSHKANDFVRGDTAAIRGHIAQRIPRVSGGGLDASALQDLADIDIINALIVDTDSGENTVEFDEVPYAVLVDRNGPFVLEYRLNPWEEWTRLPIRQGGAFEFPVDLTGIREGLIHAELRTRQQNIPEPAIPLYLPLNRAETEPEIVFISPLEDGTPVNGFTTVSGRVRSYVPIAAIEYTTDGRSYTPLEMQAGFEKYDFTLLFNFTAIAKAGGAFSVRATDVNGAAFEKPLQAPVDAESDNPRIVFNRPLENETISDNLVISGLARDDDGVTGVYWRLTKQGENPDIRFVEDANQGSDGLPGEFTRIDTTESFRIDVPPDYLSEGEWLVEAFAEDMYGLQGSVFTRTIRVSFANPRVILAENPVTGRNYRGNTYLRGSAADENGIQGVWVSLDNGNTFLRAEGAEDWRLPLNTYFYTDGEYAPILRVRDTFDRETMDSALITIDNTPPQMDIQSPYNGQRVSGTLDVAARVLDSVKVQDVVIELMSINNSGYRMSFMPETFSPVVLASLDISDVPAGEYTLRIIATDPAGNTAAVTRNITRTLEKDALELSFFNPLPGETRAGVLTISGKVKGRIIPETVRILANRLPLEDVPVDKYGNFSYEYPLEDPPEEGALVLGEASSNTEYTLSYRTSGPAVSVDSHHDGDAITGKPWLTGKAWMEFTLEQMDSLSRKEKQNYGVRRVMISLDNGRTFSPAKGTENWKFPLECDKYNRGPLPILIRAEFANGETATRRLLLSVDTEPPQLRVLGPGRNSSQRDTLTVYGTAGDDTDLDSIMIDLRPGAGR